MAGLADQAAAAGSSASAAVVGVALEVVLFIDHEVAVVVDAVASLRGGDALILRDVPLAVAAHAGLSCRASVAAGAAVVDVVEQVEGVVDHEVAIVVLSVAGLGCRNAAVLRNVPDAGTAFAVLVQGAGMSADAAVQVVEQQVVRLVDQPVAIIVRVVADFVHGGAALAYGRIPGAKPVFAVLIGGTGVSAQAAVGRVILEAGVLIDGPVTVVVGVVAHLRGRRASVLGHDPLTVAVLADLSTGADMSADAAVGRIGRQREALVEHSVAVVIGVVAGFGKGSASVLRDVPGAGTVFAVLAPGTGVPAEAAVGRVVLQVEGFVDEAVAVVVAVVAHLRGRSATVLGNNPGTGAVRAVLTGRASSSADSAIGLVVAQIDSLVDLSVAVVVDVVTHLAGRRADVDRNLIGAMAVQAVLGRTAEIAADSAVGGIGGQVEVLVELSVAVVVDLVAGFTGRSAVGRGNVPGAMSIAAVLAAGADVTADSAVGGVDVQERVLVDRSVAVVVFVVAHFSRGGTAVLRQNPHAVAAVAGLAVGADMPAGPAVGVVGGGVDSFIDESVAVVVDVVAHLLHRDAVVDGLVERAGTVLTVLARQADPSAHAAVGVVEEQIEGVVDAAIAVIVDAVASLLHRGAVDRRRDPLAVAVVTHLLCSAGQSADTAVGFVAEQHDQLIDFAVAVVVRVVADFQGRGAVQNRVGELAVTVVTDRSRAAIPSAHAAVGRVGEQAEAFIDEAVAVVVAVVAQFGGRRCAVVDRNGEAADRVEALCSRVTAAAAGATVVRIVEQVVGIVDASVAVVVLVVAGLGDGHALVHRGVPGAVSAEAGLVGGTGMSAHSAVLLIVEKVEIVVHHTVAVVVAVVTAFRDRLAVVGGGVERAVAVCTVLAAVAGVPADAAVVRVGEQVERFVDRVVAIVVHAVAAFGAWRAAVLLLVPGAVTAVAALSVRASASAHAAVGGVGEQVIPVVDHAVAVVVDVVAGFAALRALVGGLIPGAVSVVAGLSLVAGPSAGAAVGFVAGQDDAAAEAIELGQGTAVNVAVATGSGAAIAGRAAAAGGDVVGTPWVSAVETGGSGRIAVAAADGGCEQGGQQCNVRRHPDAHLFDHLVLLLTLGRLYRAAGMASARSVSVVTPWAHHNFEHWHHLPICRSGLGVVVSVAQMIQVRSIDRPFVRSCLLPRGACRESSRCRFSPRRILCLVRAAGLQQRGSHPSEEPAGRRRGCLRNDTYVFLALLLVFSQFVEYQIKPDGSDPV